MYKDYLKSVMCPFEYSVILSTLQIDMYQIGYKNEKKKVKYIAHN